MLSRQNPFVKWGSRLAHPQFSLPVTVVNPFRGFIRPALRQSGLILIKDFQTLVLLNTYAAKPQKGWADDASSGIYHSRATTKHILLQ